MAAVFTKVNTEFTLSLLMKLPSDFNLLYSPFSISTAIAMVRLGARAETLTQIGWVLHFEEIGHDIYPVFGSYIEFLSNKTFNNTLETANKIYQRVKVKTRESFLQNCTSYFNTTLEGVDLFKSEETREKINSWVSRHTEHKIQGLIPKGALNSLIFMVQVNANYFNGTGRIGLKLRSLEWLNLGTAKGSLWQTWCLNQHFQILQYAGYVAQNNRTSIRWEHFKYVDYSPHVIEWFRKAGKEFNRVSNQERD